MSLVERIDEHFVAEAAVKTKSANVGAWNVAGCVRSLWYTLRSAPALPVEPKGMRRMALGDATERLVWSWLAASGIRFRPATSEDQIELDGIGNVRPDAFLDEPNLPRLLEVKRMSDYPFEKARDEGKISETYLGQTECYLRAFDEPAILVLCVADSGDLCEVTIRQDDERWERVLANAAAARADALPERPYVLDETCTGCKGSGRMARGDLHRACDGTGRVGPFLPKFPCAFCGYRVECWGPLEEEATVGAFGKPAKRLRVVGAKEVA